MGADGALRRNTVWSTKRQVTLTLGNERQHPIGDKGRQTPGFPSGRKDLFRCKDGPVYHKFPELRNRITPMLALLESPGGCWAPWPLLPEASPMKQKPRPTQWLLTWHLQHLPRSSATLAAQSARCSPHLLPCVDTVHYLPKARLSGVWSPVCWCQRAWVFKRQGTPRTGHALALASCPTW